MLLPLSHRCYSNRRFCHTHFSIEGPGLWLAEDCVLQAPGKVKAVVLFVHGHGAYLMHELLHVPVSFLTNAHAHSQTSWLAAQQLSRLGT